MEFNPKRSWATMYNQMWNLSMRDPLPKNSHYNNNYNQNFAGNTFASSGKAQGNSSHGAGSSSSDAVPIKKKKPEYCKNFNKRLVCKYGKRCRFTERCSHCNAVEHPVIQCP